MSLIDSSKISAQLTNYKFKASGPHIRQSNESTDRYTFRNTSFDKFSQQAYKNPSGYAIRVNPANGKKEMFVAGTRNVFDWAANLAETKYGGNMFYRKRAAEKYRKIAQANGVDVIYGHSRGGALIGDIVDTKARKVGLDAAMVISKDKNTTNYRNKGYFDRAIGLTGKNNKVIKSKRFHKVWKK
jgi:hypothetical protein